MGKVTKAKPHLTLEEIKEKIKGTVGFWRVQGWQVIWNATIDPRPAAQIAKHVGLAEQTVHNLISQYNQHGPGAIENRGRGGRFHAYLSEDEEVAFLEPFRLLAEKGEIATTAQIKVAFEKLVDRSVNPATIYRLLKRHNWRKIVPRPSHVNANPEAREAFKKTPGSGIRNPNKAKG